MGNVGRGTPGSIPDVAFARYDTRLVITEDGATEVIGDGPARSRLEAAVRAAGSETEPRPCPLESWTCRSIGGRTDVSVPTDLRYTKDHEWVRVEGDTATIGVTDFAANQLGDVVFVDLPAVGKAVEQFSTFGVVESVKAVSDLYAPLSGEVVAVNGDLGSKPELVNSDPFGDGWMIRVKVGDTAQVDELLDAAGYEKLTAEA